MCDCDDCNDCCSCCVCLDSNSRWMCIPIGFCIGFGLFLMVVLLPLSLQRVDFDAVGIQYDKITRELGTDVLREGLHDVGPAGTIIKLLRVQRQGFFKNLTTLTSDGLTVELDVDVLYSVDTVRARAIIDDFGGQESHDIFVMAIAGTVVRDVIATVTTRDFFLQRQEVSLDMEEMLRVRFVNSSAHAIVEAVQLSNVEFSTAVATSLALSTTMQQDIENAKSEKATLEKAANNRRILSRLDADLVLLNADRAKRIRDIQAETDAAAISAGLLHRAEAWGNISSYFTDSIGTDSYFFVHGYLKNLLLRLNVGRTIVGLD